jgi:hypothetical protein
MTNELDEKLCAKYPKIFVDRHGDMRSTAMCWGIECGDGWYWLIDNLCQTIQSYLDNNKHLGISQVIAVQVKEKYGTLRFYYSGGDETVGGMVWFAEHLSGRICESCGSAKDVAKTQGGWIQTLCGVCRQEEEK